MHPSHTPPLRALGAIASLAIASVSACSSGHDTRADSARTATTASAAGAVSASDSASTRGPTDITPVRGTISAVSDSVLTVKTAAGDVRVKVEPPLHLYTRQPSDLSRVTEHTFVGVTSVKQPDGTQRATEIHIFPEDLRGTGEGSYPMAQPSADSSAGSPRTMTNGTIARSGSRPGASPRMTNGAVTTNAGGTITVQYNGGTQTITVPKDVSVTAIVPVQTPLIGGANVVVLAKKQGDGSLAASRVMLMTPR